jgi:hypothetical protein
MGIEHIAREPLTVSNHGVASADWRCVRYSCEKQRHTSQCGHWRRITNYGALHGLGRRCLSSIHDEVMRRIWGNLAEMSIDGYRTRVFLTPIGVLSTRCSRIW